MSKWSNVLFESLDPAEMPTSLVYALLVCTVQPRPIAFVSSLSAEGAPNLAPFSFFTAGGANPPSLVFSTVLRADGSAKDTLRNVEQTREYVVNMVTRAMAVQMNEASAEVAPGEDEWKRARLTPVPSEVVKPARVAESNVQFECKLHEIVRHGSGGNAAAYVIGEVVRMHVEASLWQEGKIDPSAFRPIGRMGGSEYVDTDGPEIFTMQRPKLDQAPS